MKLLKEIVSYGLILLLVVFIRFFLVTPVIIDGDSMDPTLKEEEIVLLNKIDKKYDRYKIVVIDYQDERLIKRIIGLPGENIKCKNGVVYINGKPIDDSFNLITDDFEEIKIKEEYYFLMGDNRTVSLDSRRIGSIPKSNIKGTVNFIFFPFKRFGFID
ncbi:MAG: signal peptidase I [Bacilli bacterium]|nr:signal peptidase I [Bacilli bacterium]MDD4733522.1 signal peptidase I [Bacilli bacterium]